MGVYGNNYKIKGLVGHISAHCTVSLEVLDGDEGGHVVSARPDVLRPSAWLGGAEQVRISGQQRNTPCG